MCIRLQSANTDTARRTLELFKFKPRVSMSSSESRNRTVKQSAIRLENRLNEFKRVNDE